MRKILKKIINAICLTISSPIALLCFIEKILFKNSEIVFIIFSHGYALLPGIPGSYLRRTFYSLTLEHCSTNCHIGFGSIFTHRNAVVKENVSIGNFAIIGSAIIGKRCEIASRVSITSGRHQHVKGPEGQWIQSPKHTKSRVYIGSDVWIGEGAIVMANVGRSCLIAAGSVVINNVTEETMVAGNPAKKIRKTSHLC